MKHKGHRWLERVERRNKESTNWICSRLDELKASLSGDPEDQINLFSSQIPGTRMLDVGCGWSRFAHRFVTHGLSYLGVDISEGMLAEAQRLNPDLPFAVMSFRRLAFAEEQFDGVFCAYTLQYEPKKNVIAVLQEMRRVIVPGGVILISVPTSDESGEAFIAWENENGIHHSYYLHYELATCITKAGFRIEKKVQRPKEGTMYFLARK